MWVNMYVLTKLGRLHCTHQDISFEEWQCQWSDICACVCEDWWASVWQQPYCGEWESEDGGRIRGRNVLAPSCSQVNIDTALADTAPAVPINHFQWTHTNAPAHTLAQAESQTTHGGKKKYNQSFKVIQKHEAFGQVGGGRREMYLPDVHVDVKLGLPWLAILKLQVSLV